MGSDAPGDALSALLVAAHDQDSGVRRAAVNSLQLLGAHGPDVVKTMAGALSDPDWVVRQEAAGAFASFGVVDAATVEAIEQGLASEDWQVRYSAVTALSGLAPDNTVDLKKLTKLSDATVTVDLENGKTISFAHASYTAEGKVTPEEGEIEARFECDPDDAEEIS